MDGEVQAENFTLNDMLTIQSDFRLELYQKYLKENTNSSYISWLEDQLNEHKV
jgi:hypothetical protein